MNGQTATDSETRYVSLKDLARLMDLHTRSVKRWWKRLKVPPTVPAHACHRWSPAAAKLLLHRWQAHSQKQTLKAHARPD